jgi:hypothetical protein
MLAVSVCPRIADPDIVGVGVEAKVGVPRYKSDVGSPDLPELMAPGFLDFNIDSKFE